jgi:hypothetical protein
MFWDIRNLFIVHIKKYKNNFMLFSLYGYMGIDIQRS